MKIQTILAIVAVTSFSFLATAADKLPAVSDPTVAAADPDFALQGEYTGMAGDEKIGVQVIALGDGEFESVICMGGLPGDGWDGTKPRDRTQAKRAEDGSVTFQKDVWTGLLKGGKLIGTTTEDASVEIVLERVERESPTLGAVAPDGAILLFDGSAETAAEQWQNPKLEGDLLTEGVASKGEFTDFSIHIEFRLPWMPKARGQGRGNSGIYLTGRYEVQMLDSFGLAGVDNECGGIYKVAEPKQNLCYPPLRWQTYDIDFTAAKVDAEGKKIANAKVTVIHNGYVIHEDLEIPETTGGAKSKVEGLAGPIFLQNHGNPVRYRNIWVVKH